MRRRTRAREIAIQFLYQLDLRTDDVFDELESFLDRECRSDPTSETAKEPAPKPVDASSTTDVVHADSEGGEEPRLDGAALELRRFSKRLIEGTVRHRDDIDRVLTKVARNWDLRRMAVLDRNILRMAAFELLHCTDIPPKVTINEAIELGKRFSTANSGGFINGILDRIRIDSAREPDAAIPTEA